MSESAATLELRHSTLADAAPVSPAPLADGTEGVFVAIDDPPPVRTVLTVVQGDQRRPLEVTAVVEVIDRSAQTTRGFFGRWVDAEALERAGKMGTEHLEDGTPVVQKVDPSVSDDGSDAPAAMAMPAPVMIIEDDTGVVHVGDDDDDDDDGYDDREDADVAAARDEASSADAEHQGAADQPASADASDDPADREPETDRATDPDMAVAPAPDGADASSSELAASSEGDEPAGDDPDAGKRKGRKKRGRRRR